MQVRTAADGSIALDGRLDVNAVADVRAVLHAAVDAGRGDLVLDLTDLEILDATGLGVLIGVHRRAERAGRRLVLREVPDRVARLLRATRLDRVLTVVSAASRTATDTAVREPVAS